MVGKWWMAVVLFCLVFAATPCAADGAAQKTGPRPAAKEMTTEGALRLSPGDRCPICGMYPAKRPKTAAGMQLSDGRTFYFCGNGCLLRTWRFSDKYLAVSSDAIDRMRVRDFFTGETIDARSAWWIAGSDVIGPMGPALVALESRGAVDAFKERHGGQLVFQLADMDDALWKKLFPGKKK